MIMPSYATIYWQVASSPEDIGGELSLGLAEAGTRGAVQAVDLQNKRK
jgi:hypothetical protein